MSTRDHIATYSPDDDKIRIYPAYRLPADQYAEVKAAGYGWAPKSECFYAVWSPNREETALNFAAEIEDEDKSLIDRAEDRADRFTDYSEKRANDADRAREQVNTLTEHIPMGQPILVGHHSEKHARRQAKQIESAMTRAVSAWETSEYWTRRAAAAISHAKYKERPDVRARRIKTIEADKRKQERNQTDAQKWLDRYNAPDILTATIKDGRHFSRNQRNQHTFNNPTRRPKGVNAMSNPTPNEPRTPVIFRRFANGEIIAIFPTLPGTNSPNTCTNYMHTGQHGHGSDSLAGTKAASPEQYASLKTELTAIGYKLEIRYRVTDNDRRERRAELARMEPPSCY